MKDIVTKTGHAAWRLLPREFRRNSMTAIAAQLAARPDPVPPAASDGIVVAGDMQGANGLAESARIMREVFTNLGVDRGGMELGLPSVVPASSHALPAGAALLAVVNAPVLPVGLLRLKRDLLKNRRVIGLWAWELPAMPRQWAHGAGFVHEVWAPSQFCADAMQAIVPGRVRVVPHPIAAVNLPVAGNRQTLGLPSDRLIILTIFNLASSMERKNPLGAIAAFKAAFGTDTGYLFVMKLSGTEHYKADLAKIQEAVAGAANIRLLTRTLPEPELRGLIAASDIVLSLHRSEGFGLIPATAMLLGRPVIATGWSGNLDFMTSETSILVDYRLVPVSDPRGVYDVPGATWAEPSVEDAAAGLRRLAEDASLRATLGAAGKAHASSVLGTAPLLAALAANGIA